MKSIRNIVFLLLVLTCSFALAHTWTAKSGHKLEGEFDKLEDGVVHISLPNGKTGKVKLDLLSEADQKYAKDQQAAKDESPFEIYESAPAKPYSATKKTEMGHSVKQTTNVTVEGIGSTFENAKVDAFRNAVNEVVGTIVDSETRVTQEKVLEQVLTTSNAYVEKHKILSQEQKDGLWHVKMEATVESRALQMRLGESPETTSKVDGSSLLGRIETKAASEDEPVLLLAKALRDQNFPYSVMEATAEMVKDPVKKDGDKLVMQLNVSVKGNAQKFDEFRKAIEPTLEKLALSKRTMNLKTGKKQWSSGEESYIIDPPNSAMMGQDGYKLYDNETTPIFVYLNTTRNSSVTNTGWNGYEVPYKNVHLFAAYSLIVPAVEISLSDSEDNIIATERVACYAENYDSWYETYPYNSTNQFVSHVGGKRTSHGGGYYIKNLS